MHALHQWLAKWREPIETAQFHLLTFEVHLWTIVLRKRRDEPQPTWQATLLDLCASPASSSQTETPPRHSYQCH